MTRNFALTITLVLLSACSHESTSNVTAHGVENTYLFAMYAPEDPGQERTLCSFYGDRVEINTGSATTSNAVQIVPLSTPKAKRMKKLVKDAYDTEQAISTFVPENPGAACNEMALVEVFDTTQGTNSQAGIHFFSECAGFGGNWRAGQASETLMDEFVATYCPAALAHRL